MGHSCRRAGLILRLLFLLLIVCFIPPLRNLALWPVWPRSWRPLSTFQVLEMLLDEQHVYDVAAYVKRLDCGAQEGTLGADVGDEEGHNKHDPHTENDPPTLALKPRKGDELIIANAQRWVSANRERWERYRRYLPQMTAQLKARLIRTWRVLDGACRAHNLTYFLVEGTLLGVYRHGGIIPWDDDIDVAMEARDWQKILRVLSCVPGYNLKTNDKLHWKFYPDDANSNYHPFVDIFLVAHDEAYTWAVTSYVKTATVFRSDYIYPLTHAPFEGYMAPVPRDAKTILDIMFDVSECQSPWHNHQIGQGFSSSEVSRLPCLELSGMYTLRDV